MLKISATIKIPTEYVEEYLERLNKEGIETIVVEIIPYDRFVRESRLNYDCVFPQMWEEKKEVSYLRFTFGDSAEGRDACFRLEYNLMQIPLNLRYEEEE